MKKYFLFSVVAIIATTLSLTSCSQDDDVKVPADNGAVKFSSNITSLNPALRAAGNTWDANDAIGVYMLESASTNIVDNMENIEYFTSASGTEGSFEARNSVIYFPLNGNEVRFMSYYPYKGAVVANSNVYSVDVTDQSSQSKIDLLYSFKTDGSFDKTTTTPVPLVFEHQLTKVFINVKAGDGLTVNDLQDLKVHFSGLNTEAEFDLLSGTLGSPAGDDVNITPLKISTESGSVASYEAIILPMGSVPSGAKIVFDLDNGDVENESDKFTWEFDKPLNSSTKYIYNVTINRAGVTVTATILDWTDGGEPSDVTAE